jgi:poly-gamma-glutamate synthesis protein (capsule biosynthesis protein)
LLLALTAASAQVPTVLTLTFAGDIMGHDVNYHMKDFHDIYRDVRDVWESGDLTFANLEFPVDPTRPVSGYPSFNGSREYWKAAVDSGIEVFSLANNHAFDQGKEGIDQTLRSVEAIEELSGSRIYISGIRGNPSAPFLPVEIDIKGLRVGYMAATQFINQGVACPYVNIVNYLVPEEANRFAAFVREESPLFDVFIVSYHGGREYSPAASPAMLSFFRRLLENGAHIVYGHHPHVLQTARLVRMNGETRASLPSIGNFISGMTWNSSLSPPRLTYAATGDSALIRIELTRVGADVSVTGFEAVPISNYENSRGEMVVGKLEELAAGRMGLNAAWTAYFRGRLGAIRKILDPITEGD